MNTYQVSQERTAQVWAWYWAGYSLREMRKMAREKGWRHASVERLHCYLVKAARQHETRYVDLNPPFLKKPGLVADNQA